MFQPGSNLLAAVQQYSSGKRSDAYVIAVQQEQNSQQTQSQQAADDCTPLEVKPHVKCN
jgi:hypothetical protein